MTERWLPVVGYEGLYSVSDCGRVRSEERFVRHNLGGLSRKRQRIRRVELDRYGYPQVILSREGVNRMRKIHTLVLEAFVGPRPEGIIACHNNGIRDDARPENLRWDTPLNNSADMYLHDTVPWGERNPRAKLTEADVHYIRSNTISSYTLADRFGVNSSLVRNVRRRKVWRHI